MTIAAARSWLRGVFAIDRRSSAELPHAAATPPTLRSDWLSIASCFGVIAIAIVALTGYVLGNVSIASLGFYGEPVSVGTALGFIVLAAGLLVLRSPAPAGALTLRRAALGVIVLVAADLLSAALSPHIEEWQMWAARGGVNLHPYPISSFLLIVSASALVLVAARRDLAAHVIASAVLLTCGVILFAYLVKVPTFIDPSKRIAPVAATALGLALISVAQLLARPRGWVIPLLSRTSAGTMSRLLLPAVVVVPLLALTVHEVNVRWFAAEAGFTAFVALHAFFGAAIVLSVGVILLKRERDRALLASIVDSATDSIVGVSATGVIESWNAGAERMYGYMAAEAIGRPIAMLEAFPERHDEVSLLIARSQRGERVGPMETIRVTKDGRRIDVWLSVSPIFDSEGRVVGASTITHDISDRVRAEEVIRRQAEQYAAVLATSTDGFWLADLDGRLLDVNDAYCRMSGYSREELLGMTLHDVEAFETPAETGRHIRNIVETGFDRFETKHRTKDNRIIDIEASVSQSRTTGQVLGFGRDITQRKREHEALRSSEERLQLAQQAAGIGHFSWDLQKNVIEWSDELTALYGLAPGSFGGKYEAFAERVFPDDLPGVEAEIRKSMASGEFSCDFRVVWPDASIRWLHARGKVSLSGDGKPLRMVGVNMDVTASKRTEEALRKSEAALREAQQIAHIGSWVLDAESRELVVSDEAFRIFAVEPRPVAPMQLFLDRIHEEDRAALEADIAAALQTGTLDAEVRIVTPDGTRVAHIIARKHEAGVARPGLIGTTQDITQRKANEDALRRHGESLERSNLDLERFNRAAVGREMRMIELKRQINELSAELGRPVPYRLPAEDGTLATETQ